MTDTNQPDLISSDGLPAEHKNCIRKIAGQMIPASTEFQLPGADGPSIIGNILQRLGGQSSMVAQIYHSLEKASLENFQQPCTKINDEGFNLLLTDFRNRREALAASLMVTVVACYYEDKRVLDSIEHESRPPFPLGHKLQQGNWDLLEPVKNRPKFYRRPES